MFRVLVVTYASQPLPLPSWVATNAADHQLCDSVSDMTAWLPVTVVSACIYNFITPMCSTNCQSMWPASSSQPTWAAYTHISIFLVYTARTWQLCQRSICHNVCHLILHFLQGKSNLMDLILNWIEESLLKQELLPTIFKSIRGKTLFKSLFSVLRFNMSHLPRKRSS